MRNTTKRKLDAVLEYLRRGHTVRDACALARVGKSTFYRRLESNPRFAQEVEEASAHIIDLALGVIAQKIADGDARLAAWILEKRGVFRQVVEDAKPTDIEPEFILPPEAQGE